MRTDLPSGTVTFCFTDVEGSTRLLDSLGTEAYAEALAEHRLIVREACAAQGGVEVDTQGDAFFFAFPTAIGALAAASAFTEALASTEIRVRCGLHTGEPLIAEEGYVGHDVHLAARVASAGHGGQVLVSPSTVALLDVERGGESNSLLQALSPLGAHRLKDVEEPLRLYQLGAGAFPPLKTLANSNLPTPASSFLGREDELYDADELLRSTRLLTISGPGGQGKTRFALELARRAREGRFSDYEDGVYSSFFASLRDPALVLATIAHTLSLSEQPGQSVLDTLASHLEGKRMLLLCDNLEHLLDAASELSQLLERAPGLTLLVTSREVLRLRGETTYLLPPLPEAEGVALFCERARVEPSPEIHELAQRLEGLPLAIELAAARLAILTPAQLLERLTKRLDLLKGTRDADARQQTLRATIEWSYDLLSPAEQRLFRSLSVFAGGCTLEAAEDVCGADLDTLQSLVDKSLLRFTEERFWMLETLREFAAERLEQAGETDALRDRHATWLLALAARAAVGLESETLLEWLSRLEAERDNIRAGHARLAEASDIDGQLELAGRLWQFWNLRGDWREARKLVAPALRGARSQRTLRHALALHADSAWAGRLGLLEEAKAAAEASLDIFREIGDSKGVAWKLIHLATFAIEEGDTSEAERLFLEALDHADASGDPRIVPAVRGNLAVLALHQRSYVDALEEAEAVERLWRDLGHEAPAAWMTSLRAHCLVRLGQVDIAARLARESLETAALQGVANVVGPLTTLAACARAQGDSPGAAMLLGAVAALSEDILEVPLGGPDRDLYETVLSATSQDLEAVFDHHFDVGRHLGTQEAIARALEDTAVAEEATSGNWRNE